MKFVIIGADAAGMSAASRARRNDPGLEIMVLEQGRDVSYSACNIPYNIADPGREMDDLSVRSAAVFREKQGIDLRVEHRVERIDREARTVSGRAGDGAPFSAAYDQLLIAVGANPILPSIEGIDLPGVFVVKNLEHGRRIKAFLRSRQAKRAVIVGMGYIALEMAEALCELGLKVDLIKPRAGLLPWLDPALGQPVRELLLAQGVGLYDGHPIDRIVAAGDNLRVISGALQLEADLVVAAIGVVPNAQLAQDAGLELSVGGSIAADRSLRTSDPNIYAAGDCADSYHVVTGQKTWIPLALRANRAGWAVADNVCGGRVELPGVAGTAVFKVFAMQIARTGLSAGEARKAGFDPVGVQIKSKSRAGIYPGAQPIYVSMVGDRATGRLLGAQMTGTDQVAHRINAVAVALLAKMSVAEFSQSDLAYAPPFGPTWDPLLTAANQLVKNFSLLLKESLAMKKEYEDIDQDLTNSLSSPYVAMAGKYCVEDQSSALLPGTRISKILELLESGLPISNIRLEYLRGKGLWALLQYARKEVGFAEFLKAAKSEQSARCLLKATEIEQEKTKEKLREAEWRAKEAAMFDSIKRGRERVRAEKRAFDADPENIAKSKQLKLRGKYGFSQFVDKNHFHQLMDIVRRIDQGERLSKNEVAWLMTTGNKTDNSYKNYYTEELREGYHQNEAEFHANEFKKKKDPWLAVNASGHYRKGNRAAIADLMLSGIDVGRVKNLKLKSALCTTHGGVKRDLNKKEDALALGEQAHSLTPQDYRPCTLLGAVNIEMGHYELGHSWYAKAVDRGYTEEGVDAELRGIFMRADESEQEKLREYLLGIDPCRYNWAKKIGNLN